ncbi:MAG: hypothetical protein WCT14_01210 [Treponemataceae bacterium]
MTRFTRYALSMRLQWRHGFIPAFAVTLALLTAILRSLPLSFKLPAAQAMIASDPLFFAFFFSGAFLMLEKSDGTIAALAASPYPAHEYLLERGLAVGLVAAASGTALAAFSDITAWTPFPIVAAQLVGSACAGAAGIAVASRVKSINGFFIASVPAMALMAVPLLSALFGFPSETIAAFFPGWAVVSWIGAGLGRSTSIGNVIASLANGAFWTAAAFIAAERSFSRLFRDAGRTAP